MQSGIECVLPLGLQKVVALLPCFAGLLCQGFMQRQVAVDHVFIAIVQALQQRQRGNACGLAALASIAALARQHQVPHAVQVGVGGVEHPGKKMVHVGEVLVAGLQADIAIAVEAAALLVAVQAVPAAGDIDAPRVLAAEQQLILRVILHRDQVAGNAKRPGLFDQPPAGVGFLYQVVKLRGLCQLVEVIGQANALAGSAFVDKKAFVDFCAVNVMESINYVGKAMTHGLFNQLRFINLIVIELYAARQKLAATRGDLFRRMVQVRAEMAGKGRSQGFQRDQVVLMLL